MYKDFAEPTVDLNTDGRSRIVRPAPGPKKIVEYSLLATNSINESIDREGDSSVVGKRKNKSECRVRGWRLDFGGVLTAKEPLKRPPECMQGRRGIELAGVELGNSGACDREG